MSSIPSGGAGGITFTALGDPILGGVRPKEAIRCAQLFCCFSPLPQRNSIKS